MDDNNQNVRSGGRNTKKIFLIIFLFASIVFIDNILESKGIYSYIISELNNISPTSKLRLLQRLNNEAQVVSPETTGQILEYEFARNITSMLYLGKWNNLEIKNNTLERKSGKLEMKVFINNTISNYIANIEQEQSLVFYMDANDGNFKDRWISFNFSMPLTKGFSKQLEGGDGSGAVKMRNNNITLYYSHNELFESNTNGNCNATSLEIDFIADEKTFRREYEYINIILYSKVKGRIHDQTCQFNLDFEMEASDDIVSYINSRINQIGFGTILYSSLRFLLLKYTSLLGYYTKLLKTLNLAKM
jgi:hypothetical protein